jgi:hypothetical protein
MKVNLDVTPEFLPYWEDDQDFHYLISGEIKKVSFQLKQSSPLDNLGNVVAGKIPQWAGQIVGETTTLEYKTSSMDDDAQFVTIRPDEQGCNRICIIDRFCRVKQWLSPSGFSADGSGGPQVGQTGMLIPLGSGIGPIIFVSKRDGNLEIYRLDGAGTAEAEVTRLTTESADDDLPTWAYYTKKIYFTSKRSGVRRIYEMNADGSEQKELDLE